MKKIVFIAIIFIVAVTAKAKPISGAYNAYEDGKLVAIIALDSNGNCSLASLERDNKFKLNGTYTYENDQYISKGGSEYITLNLDGKPYRVYYFWGTQEKNPGLAFDGLVFYLQRR